MRKGGGVPRANQVVAAFDVFTGVQSFLGAPVMLGWREAAPDLAACMGHALVAVLVRSMGRE